MRVLLDVVNPFGAEESGAMLVAGDQCFLYFHSVLFQRHCGFSPAVGGGVSGLHVWWRAEKRNWFLTLSRP